MLLGIGKSQLHLSDLLALQAQHAWYLEEELYRLRADGQGVERAVFTSLGPHVLGAAMGDNQVGFDPPRLVPWSAAMAMGTLILCGVVAGLYPASKAASLQPVEALRKE